MPQLYHSLNSRDAETADIARFPPPNPAEYRAGCERLYADMTLQIRYVEKLP